MTQALRFAAKLAKSSEEVDYRDRKAAWIGVAGLQVALRQLLSEGMLTRSETVLLGYEANRLWTAAASRRSADGFFGESPVVPDDDDAEDPFKPRPSRMPWGRAGNRYESPFDMLSYPGCRSVGQWTRMLAKAVKENQISPTVLRELTLHLGAVWKSMEADLDDEIWDEDSFDDDEDADSGLF